MQEKGRTRAQLLNELQVMRKRITELETLQRTGLLLTSSLDLSTVLDSIAESALALVGASDCLIYLYDSERERFSFGTVLGRLSADGSVRAPRRNGLTATVVREGRPVVINDAAGHPLYASPEVQQWNIQAVAGLPLQRAGRVLGVLNVVFDKPHTFCEDDLRVLGLLADQAATAIDNSQLYAKAQQEIAERMRTEEALRRLQALNEGIVQNTGEGIVVDDAQGRFTFVNPAAAALLGYEVDELVGQHYTLIVPPDQQPAAQAANERRARGQADRYELQLVGKDGTRVPVQVSGSPRFDEDTGQYAGTLAVFTDLTERMHVEEELRKHRDHLEELVSDRTAALRGVNAHLQHEIGERKRAEAERERLLIVERAQARQQAALVRLSAELAATLDEVEVCQRVVRGLHDTLGYDFVALYMMDEITSARVHVASVGFADPPARIPPGQGLSERPLLDGQVRYTPNVTQTPSYYYGAGGSEVDVPVRIGGTPLGVLTAERRDPDAFSQDDLEVLTAAAQQAGLAIEKARLYDQAQQEIAERERVEAELRRYQGRLEELVDERTAELRRSEAGYRTLFDGVPVGLYRTTPAGQIVDANLAAVQMLGYPSREDLLAVNVVDLYVHPEDRTRLRELVERRDVLRDFEAQLHRQDGTVIWANLTLRAVRDEQGQVLHYEGSLEDISERKHAEEQLRKYQEHLEELVQERTAELRESEERYRTLFDGVPVGLYRTTPAGEFVDANLAFVQMLDFPSRESLLAINPVSYYVNPKEHERWRALMEREGIVRDFEAQVYRHDHTAIWVSDTARAVRDERGQVLCYEGSVEDITKRKQAEEELHRYQGHLEELVEERAADLQASEERYRTLFDGVPVGLYRSTPAGQMVDANLALVQMLGYPSREEYLAINPASVYLDPRERGRWIALMEREGVVRDFEAQARRYDGTVIWVNDTARAVKDEQSQVLYYEGSLEDITERKQAEEELRKYQEHLEELVQERTAELRESEERYRTLFDGVPVGLYRTMPTGQVLDSNLAANQMLGYQTKEASLASNTADLYVNPQDHARWKALMEREGVVRDFEVQIRRPDGKIIWVSDTARTVRDERGQVLYYEGSLEDITERKRFEEEIRRQKEYYEALFVNNPVAVVTADLDGNIVSWNPIAEKLFGYSAAEVIGKNLDDFVANEDSLRDEARGYTNQVLRHMGRIQVTTRRTRRDGSLVDVELLALPVVVAGEKVGFIVIYVDISDLQDARRQAEAANQAKGTFLANMSHELRTPLNAILGFTQLMDGDPNLTADQLENLEIINQSGEHLLVLINDVLEMSKIEAGRVTLQEKSFDLYRLLGGLEEMFGLRAEEKGLVLSFERTETVPQYVRTDEGKLRQVLSNLLGNAIKFTQEGGVTLGVSSSEYRVDSKDDSLPLLHTPTYTLHFKVQDTGPGIAPEELGAVFDPFVQASSGQQAQEGTGLGLSISREYARLLGGDVTVSSELGQGSVFGFDVRVGLTPDGVTEAEEAQPMRQVIGLAPDQPTYRLLVAEDREANRRLLVKLLGDLGSPPLGFEIRKARNGREAIEIWERWEPHLIWMDMRMPVVDGYEATRQIKATDKGRHTIIIALTASAFEEDRERVLAEGCDGFVRKPFRKGEIYDVLAKHLGVRFAYQEPEEGGLGIGEKEKGAAAHASSLAAMSPEWLADLRQATIKANSNQILALIGQIRGQDPALADTLVGLVHDFEYKKILALIDRAGG